VEKMSSIWIAVIGSSITAFLNKYIGHSVPERWLELVIDQRLVGVSVALIALKLKASFPVVVLAAAVSSAAVYNLF
jgi:hypothetical protein